MNKFHCHIFADSLHTVSLHLVLPTFTPHPCSSHFYHPNSPSSLELLSTRCAFFNLLSPWLSLHSCFSPQITVAVQCVVCLVIPSWNENAARKFDFVSALSPVTHPFSSAVVRSVLNLSFYSAAQPHSATLALERRYGEGRR